MPDDWTIDALCSICKKRLRVTKEVWIDSYQYYYTLHCGCCGGNIEGTGLASVQHTPFWKEDNWAERIELPKMERHIRKKIKIPRDLIGVGNDRSDRQKGRSVAARRKTKGNSDRIGQRIYGGTRTHRARARYIRKNGGDES